MISMFLDESAPQPPQPGYRDLWAGCVAGGPLSGLALAEAPAGSAFFASFFSGFLSPSVDFAFSLSVESRFRPFLP